MGSVKRRNRMKMVMMIIILDDIGICIRNINIIKGHPSRALLRHEVIIRIITKAQAHLNQVEAMITIVIAIKGNAIIAALANTNLNPPKNPNVKKKKYFICTDDIVICILYCKYSRSLIRFLFK